MSAPADCAHVWREDYVCTLCAAVKRGSPPLWVWELVIKAGPWAVLLALWTFADGGPDSRPVFPSNSSLRKRCRGIGESTLQGHLLTLTSMGWIRRRDLHRREFELAWFEPVFAGSTTPENLDPRKAGPPENQDTTPENPEVDPRKAGPTPPKTRTHTCSRPEFDLASDLAAHATPSESTTPDDDPNENRPSTARRADEQRGSDGSRGRPQDGANHGASDKAAKNVNASGPGRHNPSEPTFAQRVDATSEAARMARDSSSTAPAAWVPCMQAHVAEFGEDGVIKILVEWSKRPHDNRPRMGSLWHTYGPRSGQWFVEQVLGTVLAPAKRETLSDAPGDGEFARVVSMLDARAGRTAKAEGGS